uniref:THAP domain-containing protein 11-like n=1 Tax=Crassostrea virginica TaxID=6565 RepID=A0A8B8AEJ3_CRAVI|nr:THAP domain-containing protein 11-like [Crassostrea virginica]XP_022289912.1 THAP domain-containing protein 11-like [Crassostrea virginica]
MRSAKQRKNTDSPSHYWCSVPGCVSDGRKKANLNVYPWMQGVQFYPYPGSTRKPRLRRQWLQQVFRDENYSPKRYHSVCSLHFVDSHSTENNPIPTLFPRNNFKIPTYVRNTVSIEKRQTTATVISSTASDPIIPSSQSTERSTLEDITVLCQGNTCTPLGLSVAHECIIDVQTSNGDCSEEPSSNTITKDISHGNLNHEHDYYKQSVKPRCTGDFVDCAVQTDLTMEDVEHMETLTKE